ncbi:MAG: hypothetical protein K7J46_05375 [Bryobacter sp.]|nr:hypothetical protein [Bryobacter sp. CoA8 C33]
MDFDTRLKRIDSFGYFVNFAFRARRIEEVLALAQEEKEMLESLRQLDSENDAVRSFLANRYNSLSAAFLNCARLEEALSLLRKAFDARRSFARTDQLESLALLALYKLRIGSIAHQLGDRQQAKSNWVWAREAFIKVLSQLKAPPQEQRTLSQSLLFMNTQIRLATLDTYEDQTEESLRRLRLAWDSLQSVRTLAQDSNPAVLRIYHRALLGRLIVIHETLGLPFTLTEQGKPIPAADLALAKIHGHMSIFEDMFSTGFDPIRLLDSARKAKNLSQEILARTPSPDARSAAARAALGFAKTVDILQRFPLSNIPTLDEAIESARLAVQLLEENRPVARDREVAAEEEELLHEARQIAAVLQYLNTRGQSSPAPNSAGNVFRPSSRL